MLGGANLEVLLIDWRRRYDALNTKLNFCVVCSKPWPKTAGGEISTDADEHVKSEHGWTDQDMDNFCDIIDEETERLKREYQQLQELAKKRQQNDLFNHVLAGVFLGAIMD